MVWWKTLENFEVGQTPLQKCFAGILPIAKLAVLWKTTLCVCTIMVVGRVLTCFSHPSLLTHSPSLTSSLPPLLTHSLTHPLLPFLTPSLPHSLPSSPSLPHSLTPSHPLPPSLLPFLTPSHPLPPSLTPSKARNWIKELKRMLGDKVTLCIVGNKIDLDRQRTVSEKDALE